jgi:hypothetical protein
MAEKKKTLPSLTVNGIPEDLLQQIDEMAARKKVDDHVSNDSIYSEIVAMRRSATNGYNPMSAALGQR